MFEIPRDETGLSISRLIDLKRKGYKVVKFEEVIEESLRCKHSWEDCDNSYSSACDYCMRNDITKRKIGDYYKPRPINHV